MMELLGNDVLRYELLSTQEQEQLENELRGEAFEFAIEVESPGGFDHVDKEKKKLSLTWAQLFKANDVVS